MPISRSRQVSLSDIPRYETNVDDATHSESFIRQWASVAVNRDQDVTIPVDASEWDAQTPHNAQNDRVLDEISIHLDRDTLMSDHRSDSGTDTDMSDGEVDKFQADVFGVLSRLRDQTPENYRPQSAVETLLAEVVEKSILEVVGTRLYQAMAAPNNVVPPDLNILVSGVIFSVHRVLFKSVFPDVPLREDTKEVYMYCNPLIFGIIVAYVYTGSRETTYFALLHIVQTDMGSRKRIIWDFIYIIAKYCCGTYWQLRELADVVWEVLIHTV